MQTKCSNRILRVLLRAALLARDLLRIDTPYLLQVGVEGLEGDLFEGINP